MPRWGHHRVGDDRRRLLRRLDDHVPAAADTVHPRLDHAGGEGGGHRGIDRVPTPAQDIRACGGRLRRLGGDHPAPPARFQPADLPLRLHWHRSSLARVARLSRADHRRPAVETELRNGY